MTDCHLLCPAYAAPEDAEARQQAITSAQDFCQHLGWNLAMSSTAQSGAPAGHWASRERRLLDCEQGWQAEWWWAWRGGHGCQHLVPGLISLADQHGPPPGLIGFSDCTVLHGLWSSKGWGATCHAFMPAVRYGERAWHSLAALLNGETVHYDHSSNPSVQPLSSGTARGPVFAGCLAVLAACVGTPAMPPLDGAILALEDIDEQPYQLDRSLEQLAQGGCLDGISGLVLGTFPISDPLGRGPALEEVLGSWAQRLGVPCLAGLPFGHVADPLALPVGGSAELNIGGTSWSFRASL